MWPAMYNVETVYKDEDFKLSTEEVDGELFVHLRLQSASRSIIERVLQEFAKVKAKAYWDGREAVYTYTKDSRMLRIIPFAEYVGDVMFNGDVYKVGKWELN